MNPARGIPGADLAEEADPRRSIDDLRDTIDEVRFSGVETVGGVRTRRFQVVTGPAAKQKGASDNHPTVTQFWFDSHGRVVRRQTDLAQTGSATFTWAKWGKPVTIVRPKADTVITLKRLEQLRKAVGPFPMKMQWCKFRNRSRDHVILITVLQIPSLAPVRTRSWVAFRGLSKRSRVWL